MTDDRSDDFYNKEFIKMVVDSGYNASSPEFISEILVSLYDYMSGKADIERGKLSAYIMEITRIVGRSHVQTLSVDDMCDWIVWYKSQGFPEPPPYDSRP